MRRGLPPRPGAVPRGEIRRVLEVDAERRFETACVGTTLGVIKSLSLGLAALFAAFGIANAIRLPPPAALYLTLHDAGLVVLFVGIRLVAPRLLRPHPTNVLVTTLVPLAILSNTMVSAMYDATPMPTLYAALVIVGLGSSYLVRRWAILAMIACGGSWLPVAFHVSSTTVEFGEHVVVVLTAMAMGLLMNHGSRTVARRITLLHARDAAREHELEAALSAAKRAGAELDHKVEERTAELAAARDAIAAELADRKIAEEQRRTLERSLADAQRMEAVGRLAGGVAHDFNNLLMVIGGNVELLIEGDDVAAPARADLEEIQAAVVRSSRLIRQLLALGRRQVMQTRQTTLAELIAGVRPMIERVAGADITLAIDDRDGELAITIDSAQFEQVILNLVLNARDAMQGGGRLTIRATERRIEEPAAAGHAEAAPGTYAVLEVIDTGAGMEDQVRRSVFEPFFTTKQAQHGSGLGLAAVSGIVSQHGGFIDVASEPGAGTTFSVHVLGSRVVESLAPAIPDDDRRRAIGHETLLVVEDEPILLRLATNGLTRLGYSVLSACDGEAALRALESSPTPVDLLITDVIMPGFDGVELAERVRALRPSIRVLFMSGFAGERLAARGLAHTQEVLLQKPLQIKLTEDEQAALNRSAASVQELKEAMTKLSY